MSVEDIIYSLHSVYIPENKTEGIRKIHFAERLIGNYLSQLADADFKKKICANALLCAIRESGYSVAFLATIPTEYNLKRAIEESLPSFFEMDFEKSSEEETRQEMEDEANVYKSYRERYHAIYEHLLGYFDRDMVAMYNDLYSQFESMFELAEKTHSDWNNYYFGMDIAKKHLTSEIER